MQFVSAKDAVEDQLNTVGEVISSASVLPGKRKSKKESLNGMIEASSSVAAEEGSLEPPSLPTKTESTSDALQSSTEQPGSEEKEEGDISFLLYFLSPPQNMQSIHHRR